MAFLPSGGAQTLPVRGDETFLRSCIAGCLHRGDDFHDGQSTTTTALQALKGLHTQVRGGTNKIEQAPVQRHFNMQPDSCGLSDDAADSWERLGIVQGPFTASLNLENGLLNHHNLDEGPGQGMEGILAHGWDADLEHKVAQFPDMTIKEDLMQPFARPSEGDAYLTPCPLGVEPHLNLALIDIEIPGYVSQAPLDIEDPAPTTGADLQHPLNKATYDLWADDTTHMACSAMIPVPALLTTHQAAAAAADSLADVFPDQLAALPCVVRVAADACCSDPSFDDVHQVHGPGHSMLATVQKHLSGPATVRHVPASTHCYQPEGSYVWSACGEDAVGPQLLPGSMLMQPVAAAPRAMLTHDTTMLSDECLSAPDQQHPFSALSCMLPVHLSPATNPESDPSEEHNTHQHLLELSSSKPESPASSLDVMHRQSDGSSKESQDGSSGGEGQGSHKPSTTGGGRSLRAKTNMPNFAAMAAGKLQTKEQVGSTTRTPGRSKQVHRRQSTVTATSPAKQHPPPHQQPQVGASPFAAAPAMPSTPSPNSWTSSPGKATAGDALIDIAAVSGFASQVYLGCGINELSHVVQQQHVDASGQAGSNMDEAAVVDIPLLGPLGYDCWQVPQHIGLPGGDPQLQLMEAATVCLAGHGLPDFMHPPALDLQPMGSTAAAGLAPSTCMFPALMPDLLLQAPVLPALPTAGNSADGMPRTASRAASSKRLLSSPSDIAAAIKDLQALAAAAGPPHSSSAMVRAATAPEVPKPRGIRKKRSASTLSSSSCAASAASSSSHAACTACGAQATPVWRAGPQGPATLCNACGLRWAKVAKKDPAPGGVQSVPSPTVGPATPKQRPSSVLVKKQSAAPAPSTAE